MTRASATPEPVPDFDISAKQPFGLDTHVAIQASAGTGKTYSLTTTVARLVGEHGMRADQLLLMTFTKEATAELRNATRGRCREALHALRTGGPLPFWTVHMAADEASRTKAISHLDMFLSRYDEVTISTIHGFCQMVMKQAGLSGLMPTEFEVVGSIDILIDQVITDKLADHLAVDPLYLYGHIDEANDDAKLKKVKSSLVNMRETVKKVLSNRGSQCLPPPSTQTSSWSLDPSTLSPGSPNFHAQRIADLVAEVIEEIGDRCRSAGIITYDDMIKLVDEALGSLQTGGTQLGGQLARQFPFVLIDEFQDTDAAQWAIFKSMFVSASGNMTMLTVGDPKQAIYRFRGADVNVYLDSVDAAAEPYKLGTNRRSDKPLLDAIETLFRHTKFDSAGHVAFEPVAAAPNREHTAMQRRIDARPKKANSTAPLEIRFIERAPKDPHKADDCREAIEIDLVERIKDMLANEELLTEGDGPMEPRPVNPSDIAILVSAHRHGASIHQRLTDQGIPAVQMKAGSVLDSLAAQQMFMLLRALAHPSRANFVRTLALTWFSDFTQDDLADSSVDILQEMQSKCVEAADILRSQGFMAMYMHFRNQSAVLQRILSDKNGLRNLTDLDHVADVLGGVPELGRKAGPLEYLDVLTDLLEASDSENDEQKRRVETDAEAIQIMTIFTSKGLEFPVVFLPNLSDPIQMPSEQITMFSTTSGGTGRSVRMVDVASLFKADKRKTSPHNWSYPVDETTPPEIRPIATQNARLKLAQDDFHADRRRLLYVAMTRAKHKVVGYWFGSSQSGLGPFMRTLEDAVGQPLSPYTSANMTAAFAQLHADSGGTIEAIEIHPGRIATTPPYKHDTPTTGDQGVSAGTAAFGRGAPVTIPGFGRWSYSSVVNLLRSGHAAGSGVTVVESQPGAGDEANTDDGSPGGIPMAPFLWAGVPANARFGNAVHQIIDEIDPSSPTLDQDLRDAISMSFASWTESVDIDGLTAALGQNLAVPLDRAFKSASLRGLGTRHRLSELRFDFPLADDTGVALGAMIEVLMGDPGISDATRKHLSAMKENSAAEKQIAGFMNGSIDAVFRITGTPDTFIVCDYKTNRLHDESDADPMSSYGTRAMETAMIDGGYFIQAAIYSVALHRYLGQRLPGYDYGSHFGGVAYLFLRGLNGSTDADGNLAGCFQWKPARRTLENLDALFAEGLH